MLASPEFSVANRTAQRAKRFMYSGWPRGWPRRKRLRLQARVVGVAILCGRQGCLEPIGTYERDPQGVMVRHFRTGYVWNGRR